MITNFYMDFLNPNSRIYIFFSHSLSFLNDILFAKQSSTFPFCLDTLKVT